MSSYQQSHLGRSLWDVANSFLPFFLCWYLAYRGLAVSYWLTLAQAMPAAALQGSSYYKLPKLLQWFTGNIGLHHIHHLSPRVPNYNLQRCYDDNPLLRQVTVVTFWESLKTMSLKLWDEERGVLVGFRALKAAPPAPDAHA